MKVIVGECQGRPLTRTVTYPDHVAAIHAMIEIESRQPFDMERQQFRGRRFEWRVIENGSSGSD